jgi:hypothetical protein
MLSSNLSQHLHIFDANFNALKTFSVHTALNLKHFVEHCISIPYELQKSESEGHLSKQRVVSHIFKNNTMLQLTWLGTAGPSLWRSVFNPRQTILY